MLGTKSIDGFIGEWLWNHEAKYLHLDGVYSAVNPSWTSPILRCDPYLENQIHCNGIRTITSAVFCFDFIGFFGSLWWLFRCMLFLFPWIGLFAEYFTSLLYLLTPIQARFYAAKKRNAISLVKVVNRFLFSHVFFLWISLSLHQPKKFFFFSSFSLKWCKCFKSVITELSVWLGQNGLSPVCHFAVIWNLQ